MIKHDRVLVRFGEIALKKQKTREKLIKLLKKNIVATLNRANLKIDSITSDRSRIYISTSAPEKVAKAVQKVMGVVSASPVHTTRSELQKIVDELVRYTEGLLDKNMSFAIRVRRTGKHTFHSRDVAVLGGDKILEKYRDMNIKVDLENPDITFYVEIRQERSFIFHEIFRGPGGLPLGSQGKAVVLLSGGIDSPVATYMTMKRGVIPSFVWFDVFADEAIKKQLKDKITRIVEKLSEYASGWKLKVYFIPHTADLEKISTTLTKRYTCLFCKRLMLRKAKEIAHRENASAIITGDIIGEQASQTLHNLLVLDESICGIPIIRPLSGLNKDEVMELSRQIGTYELSITFDPSCPFRPFRPSTKAHIDNIIKEEKELDITTLVDQSISQAEVMEISNTKITI